MSGHIDRFDVNRSIISGWTGKPAYFRRVYNLYCYCRCFTVSIVISQVAYCLCFIALRFLYHRLKYNPLFCLFIWGKPKLGENDHNRFRDISVLVVLVH